MTIHQLGLDRAVDIVMKQSYRMLLLLIAGVMICALSGAASIASSGRQSPNDNSAFGINLGSVTYYSSEIVFVDLFKHSQTFA